MWIPASLVWVTPFADKFIGELSTGDCLSSTGYLYETIVVVMLAGRTYTMTMNSTALDAYLGLGPLNGAQIPWSGLTSMLHVLCGIQEGSMPITYAGSAAEVEEERRLLYVGMTRARSEADDVRREHPDWSKEYIKLYWQERLRAAFWIASR